MGQNENSDVGKMEMSCWTGNGNGMGMGMIAREWEGIGTTVVISAHLYNVRDAIEEMETTGRLIFCW